MIVDTYEVRYKIVYNNGKKLIDIDNSKYFEDRNSANTFIITLMDRFYNNYIESEYKVFESPIANFLNNVAKLECDDHNDHYSLFIDKDNNITLDLRYITGEVHCLAEKEYSLANKVIDEELI